MIKKEKINLEIELFTKQQAVDDLLSGFAFCKDATDNGNAGSTRSNKKGKVPTWVNFMSQVLLNVFIKNNLNYFIKAECKLFIMGDLKPSVDIVIFDKNDTPIWGIEVKDYTDIDMYKRFVLDVLSLRTKYPTMNFYSLSGQMALPEVSDDLKSPTAPQDVLNFIHQIDEFAFYDTLFPYNKRNSKCSIWLDKYSKDTILHNMDGLITRLSKLIK